MDGSSKRANITVTTASFDDRCGYKNPTFVQHRTSASLSYDYMMVKGGCSHFTPVIIDTDGAMRWVGTTGFSTSAATFFDNAAYLAYGPRLYRIELDGAFTLDWRLPRSRSQLLPSQYRPRQIWTYPGGYYSLLLQIGRYRSRSLFRQDFEDLELG